MKTIKSIAVLSLLFALAGCAGGTFSVGAGGSGGGVGVEVGGGAPYCAPYCAPYDTPGTIYGGPEVSVGGAGSVGSGGAVGGGVTRGW